MPSPIERKKCNNVSTKERLKETTKSFKRFELISISDIDEMEWILNHPRQLKTPESHIYILQQLELLHSFQTFNHELNYEEAAANIISHLNQPEFRDSCLLSKAGLIIHLVLKNYYSFTATDDCDFNKIQFSSIFYPINKYTHNSLLRDLQLHIDIWRWPTELESDINSACEHCQPGTAASSFQCSFTEKITDHSGTAKYFFKLSQDDIAAFVLPNSDMKRCIKVLEEISETLKKFWCELPDNFISLRKPQITEFLNALRLFRSWQLNNLFKKYGNLNYEEVAVSIINQVDRAEFKELPLQKKTLLIVHLILMNHLFTACDEYDVDKLISKSDYINYTADSLGKAFDFNVVDTYISLRCYFVDKHSYKTYEFILPTDDIVSFAASNNNIMRCRCTEFVKKICKIFENFCCEIPEGSSCKTLDAEFSSTLPKFPVWFINYLIRHKRPQISRVTCNKSNLSL